MHLTESEMLQVHNLSSEKQAHLNDCDVCKARYKNAQEIKQAFKNLAPETCPDIWLNLNNVIEEKKQRVDADKQIFRWKTFSAAIAASFMVFAVMTFINQSKVNQTNAELIAELIERSNSLQQVVFSPSTQRVISLDWVKLESDLAEIDRQIRDSYIKDASVEFKLRLWEQRYELLKHAELFNQKQTSPTKLQFTI